jgi:hypothetical protein
MRILNAVVLGLLAGCGGDGGSAPAAPTAVAPPPDTGFPSGTVLSIVSGETGDPVAGARMIVGGQALAADASGRVTLPMRLERDSPIDVLAPGFFDRITRLRSRDPLTLWPKQSASGVDEHYTIALVYSPSFEDDRLGKSGLIRLADATRDVYLVPTAEYMSDAQAAANLGDAAHLMTEATQGRFRYVVASSAPAGAVRFEVHFYPGDGRCAENRRILGYVRWNFSGFVITGGAITMCSSDAWRDPGVTLHEVGHTYGLLHSPYDYELMAPYVNRARNFGPRELLIMRLMLLRPPWNGFPDTDRHVTAVSGAWSAGIVCGR